jgi:hypothetical protein
MNLRDRIAKDINKCSHRVVVNNVRMNTVWSRPAAPAIWVHPNDDLRDCDSLRRGLAEESNHTRSAADLHATPASNYRSLIPLYVIYEIVVLDALATARRVAYGMRWQ